jgi:hypothetical protein
MSFGSIIKDAKSNAVPFLAGTATGVLAGPLVIKGLKSIKDSAARAAANNNGNSVNGGSNKPLQLS